MSDIETEIKDRIQRFVDDMHELVRRAAVEAVNSALSGPGRAMRSTRVRSSSAGVGTRRSPEKLAAVSKKLMDYVAANPGLRIEEINAAIGTSTRELRRPLTKLLGQGALRREGEKRASRYYVGKGGARRSGRKAAAKKKPARRTGAKKRTARGRKKKS